jgi:hypothetical protein
MWSAIREYIAAEIKLGIARAQEMPPGMTGPLEEQSTRMDTEIRRLAENEEKRISAISRTANSANSHHIRF